MISYKIYRIGWARERSGKFRNGYTHCAHLNFPFFSSFDSILGIIFLQPITMNRVDMTLSKQILNKFRGTGKGNLYRRVMLSTTRWSNVASTREVQEKREQLLQHQLWNPLTNQGALTQRYDGTGTTAESIVQAVLEVNLMFIYAINSAETKLEAPPPDPGERMGIRGLGMWAFTCKCSGKKGLSNLLAVPHQRWRGQR